MDDVVTTVDQPAAVAMTRDKVKVALLFHRSVSASTTEVDVKDGIATLRGTVETLSQKELTAEYTRDVEGIKEVKNELTVVRDAKRTPRTIGEKIDENLVASQAEKIILRLPDPLFTFFTAAFPDRFHHLYFVRFCKR